MDNILKNHRVNVEPHHVQQEEVPHLGLLDDDVDALLLDQSKSDVKQVGLKSYSLKFFYHVLSRLFKAVTSKQ